MKKALRVFGFLLLALIVVIGLLIAFAPQQYVLERSLTINASQGAVFAPMRNFHQWPAWTAWGEKDPTQKYTFTGEAGNTGATYHWAGEEVGEGRMTATNIDASTMRYNLDFIRPFESHNAVWVRATPEGSGTRATMGMTMNSPRPWNAMGWMFKGSVGDDFEKSLQKLKAGVEGGTLASAR